MFRRDSSSSTRVKCMFLSLLVRAFAGFLLSKEVQTKAKHYCEIEVKTKVTSLYFSFHYGWLFQIKWLGFISAKIFWFIEISHLSSVLFKLIPIYFTWGSPACRVTSHVLMVPFKVCDSLVVCTVYEVL